MLDAERVLLLISSTLFLTYISGIFYNRTRVPDIVWLLVFGMILGPILRFFDAALFLDIFDLVLLVTVPRETTERAESPIILPGEVG